MERALLAAKCASIIHAVVRRPWGLHGVDIKARTLAQVVALGIVGHPLAAGTGVRRHQDQAVFSRIALGPGLGDKVLFGAGQAREPIEHRARSRQRLRWQVNGEAHLAP